MSATRTPAEIRAWFEANAGTLTATLVAERAVRAILGLHDEVTVMVYDDAQPVCREDGQEYDGVDLPGCRTTRAIDAEINHVLRGVGVSGEDRSEPTPAPREQWAVEHPKVNLSAHNSPHSVLYTLSKLPGGRIVVRDAPDQPWRPETRCLCGESKPSDRHYTGCPDTSEVVNPTSREPRVWRHRGTEHESDPGGGVRVRDCHGDIWTPRDRGPGDRVWETPDTAPFRWDYVLKKWGPLTEVVSPEGTP